MKEENLFESALKANETKKFFKGEGRYFVRDPNWGEHVYAAHYGGWVDRYTKNSLENAENFCKSFADFIGSLDASEEDIDHFFGNLTAIAYWKNENALQNVSIFEQNTLVNKEIEGYLAKLRKSPIIESKKDLLLNYTSFITDHGFKLPLQIL